MSGTTIQEVLVHKAFTVIGRPTAEIRIRTARGGEAAACRIDPDLEESGLIPALKSLQQRLPTLLKGRDSADPAAIDRKLRHLAEEEPADAPFVSAASRAVWEAGAAAAGRELCDWIGAYSGLSGAIPMPASGAVAAGLNFGADTDYTGKPWWGFVASGFDDVGDAVNALWVVQRKWQDRIRERFGVKINVHNGNVFYPPEFFKTWEELCGHMTDTIRTAGHESRVSLFADLGASARFDPAAGLYRGLLAESMTPLEHRMALLELCRSFPVALLLDPLAEGGEEDYALLADTGALVFSPGGERGLLCELFDTLTVTEMVELAKKARAGGIPLAPRFSLSPGLRATDYCVAMGAAAAFRCGMADHGNRALELADRYPLKRINGNRKETQI